MGFGLLRERLRLLPAEDLLAQPLALEGLPLLLLLLCLLASSFGLALLHAFEDDDDLLDAARGAQLAHLLVLEPDLLDRLLVRQSLLEVFVLAEPHALPVYQVEQPLALLQLLVEPEE